MAQIWTNKNDIAGDGVDYSTIYIDGEIGEVATVTRDGSPDEMEFTLEDAGEFGRAWFNVQCVTPLMSMVFRCGDSVVVIFAGGEQ